jgi:Mn2+/Fe2+ NRAMP family transporter
MKKALEVSLGVVTGIGGFLDIGSITTAAQAGALFGYRLTWAVVLGAICVIFLTEQSGRLSALSGRTLTDAIRERFGSNYFLGLLLVLGAVTLLVLGAELGGVCIALEFATGYDLRWFALPVAFVAWLILWKGTSSVIEQGMSLLGLVTVSFAVAAFVLHPDWPAVARAALPSLPDSEDLRYWFLVTNILGAAITPYLMFFYSSGAVEDKWDRGYLAVNRVVAVVGMGVGAFLALSVLIVASQVLRPDGIRVEHYAQLGLLMSDALGPWTFGLLCASIGIACLSTALEVALSIAYLAAQGLGWNWTENKPPRTQARFALVYTGAVLVGALLVLTGIDPIRLTNLAMALTSATLPIAMLPFLFIMNDPVYVHDRGNGWVSNAVVLFVIGLAFVLAIVTIPLEIAGGG